MSRKTSIYKVCPIPLLIKYYLYHFRMNKEITLSLIFTSMFNSTISYHTHKDKDNTIRKMIIWITEYKNTDIEIEKMIFYNVKYCIDILKNNKVLHTLTWIDQK